MNTKRLVPSTVDRVAMHTPDRVNQRILNQMETRISHYMIHKGEISERLKELNREWDIDRIVETFSAGIAFTGFTLGTTVNKRWHWMSGVVAGFLLQAAVQGWSPGIAFFRRLGFRTAREIECERVALKAMRGDFEEFDADHVSPRTLLMAADPTLYQNESFGNSRRYLTTPLYM